MPKTIPDGFIAGHYRVTAIYGTLRKDTPETASGAFWTNHRFDTDLAGEFKAAAFKFEAQ